MIVSFVLWVAAAPASIAQSSRFEVSITTAAASQPVTGRLVLLISKTAQPEPRLALSLRGPVVVGLDLEQVRPDQPVIVDDAAIAYPVKLSAIPPGDYFVQAVVNVYDQVRRADGKTVWLPMNDGTIEFFTAAAGNLYSDVVPVRIGGGGDVKIAVTRVVPAAAARTDTEWIKYVTIQSKKLTQFWGRPIFIHAAVLLPKGYAEHPNTYYPSVYTLGHSWTPLSFRTTPPGGAATAGGISPVTGLENGYETYRQWNGDGFPRVIAISLIQQTPYFPDSYSVNSANNGPYGDAIVEEVIPYLEERFRIIRKPYARHLEGASTSGWQIARPPASESGFLRRRVGAATGSDRLHALCVDEHLRRHERVRDSARAVPDSGAWIPTSARWPDHPHAPTVESFRSGAGLAGPLWLSARRVGSGVWAYGQGRLSRSALGQAHRNDRP